MLGSWYLWWCQLTCTSQNFLEVPNLIWTIVGLAGTSNDQVGPTSVQTLLRPVETWTRDLLGVSWDVWHQGGWVLWGCEVSELDSHKCQDPTFPSRTFHCGGVYQCFCCRSQWFIVVTHLCLSVLCSQLVFTAPKWPKKVRCFAFDMSHVRAQNCVSGLLLLEAQLYFCVWLSWRRWCVSLVFLFEVLQERLCADSQMKSSVVNKPPLHY